MYFDLVDGSSDFDVDGSCDFDVDADADGVDVDVDVDAGSEIDCFGFDTDIIDAASDRDSGFDADAGFDVSGFGVVSGGFGVLSGFDGVSFDVDAGMISTVSGGGGGSTRGALKSCVPNHATATACNAAETATDTRNSRTGL